MFTSAKAKKETQKKPQSNLLHHKTSDYGNRTSQVVKSFRMNPLVATMLRVTGYAPLTGAIPLTEKDYNDLFKAEKSFVDYFPVVGYEEENGLFELKDGVNYGMVRRLSAVDMDTQPDDVLSEFNKRLDKALHNLPQSDKNPYIVQIFLQNGEIDNIGDNMEEVIRNSGRDIDKLDEATIQFMREHSNVLTHPEGAFQDSRVSHEKGWRVSKQNFYMVIYRVLSESEIKANRRTPKEQLITDSRSLFTSLDGLGIKNHRVDDVEFINWLAPLFSGSSDRIRNSDVERLRSTASYDIGQRIFQVAPEYHFSDDELERGIFKFGHKYLRYLTTEGVTSRPRNGCMTAQRGDLASVWEQMPTGSMMTWTIIPEPKQAMDIRLDSIQSSAIKTKSEHADFTQEQATEAKHNCLANGQRIFYTQMGCFITADSLEELLEKTLMAEDTVKMTDCLNFIKPEYDLISPDQFVRSLPFVYDFKHDRKRALRARMTYSSHLACTLPFYGTSGGSDNPCYVTYKRSGEIFQVNPFKKEDRNRVAHSVLLGATGSGKSATMNYLTIMSMCMNRPRQFIIDKGNSFGLLADYYEAMGKKVKRITFNNASTDVLSPFFETVKALKEDVDEHDEHLAEKIYEEMAQKDAQQIVDEEDEEKRSYLSEIIQVLVIMITGGRKSEEEKMGQSDLNAIQKCAINGMKRAIANGKPHARVTDMFEAMKDIAKQEENPARSSKWQDHAEALELWTTGPRGKLFNQYGEGFSEEYDLTIIEMGNLTNKGNEDMFAVAGLTTLFNITALGEKTQMAGRNIETIVDEAHYWMKASLLIEGMVEATKVWRKLGIWLQLATQDFSDFDAKSDKILSQAEFWYLLGLGEAEARKVKAFKDLTDEQLYMVKKARQEKPNFVEMTMISDKWGCSINRLVTPPIALALAQTDKDEKQARMEIMREKGITELESALVIADGIDKGRRAWQDRKLH